MESRHHPRDSELSLAALFAGGALADEVQRRMSADGYPDVRLADGLVFQHLLAGPVTIGTLARGLSISQQTVSKSIVDLERRGYAERKSVRPARPFGEPDPAGEGRGKGSSSPPRRPRRRAGRSAGFGPGAQGSQAAC